MNARIQVIFFFFFGSIASVCLHLTQTSWLPVRACVSCECEKVRLRPCVATRAPSGQRDDDMAPLHKSCGDAYTFMFVHAAYMGLFLLTKWLGCFPLTQTPLRINKKEEWKYRNLLVLQLYVFFLYDCFKFTSSFSEALDNSVKHLETAIHSSSNSPQCARDAEQRASTRGQ